MRQTQRITAVFLSLIMLISLLPLGTTVSAAAIEKEGFYLVNCSPTEGIPNVYYMPSFEPDRVADLDSFCKAYGSTFIEEIAIEMKEEFDARPEGTRFFQFQAFRAALLALNENLVYWDEAIDITKEWLTEFLKEYKRIGGKLDGIIMDIEYENMWAYYIYARFYAAKENPNKNIYKEIVADPRYQTEIRPLLVERGFYFWPDPTGDQSEIWSMNYSLWNKGYDEYWRTWDTVMAYRMSEAVNECIFAPLMKYYPNATLSDYQAEDRLGWLKQFDQYGTPIKLNAPKIGNTSNFAYYSDEIDNSVINYRNLAGYNKAVFGNEPFSMTMWIVNRFKKTCEAADTGRVNAWIAGYSNPWGKDKVFTNCNTPYYTETLFHMGLMDMSPSFIGYLVAGEEGTNYETSLRVISDILAELTRVAGASDRKNIATPVSWNGGYLLSGMYAGGRNIWRLTPNTEIVSLADFKIKDKAPTFSADGQTIVFPQGRIIKDGNVSKVGTCGYWIETPADVMPVITSTTDRYAKFPAYEENFEQYDNDTIITADTAKPTKVWETSGTALNVQTDGNSKVLAMTGTASLTNVKLPEFVTAGDSYAKQQAWEVSFKLPADLSANAVLKLLACDDNDGGIKIANGKMYYDQNGTYKELPGVSLSAGKYTVKREVDFRNEDAYKCSYSIYNEAGVLLQEVKDVPMADVTVPVTAVELACENVNSKVLIDNYKLYPTGVTTDFELYDAEIGYQLTDLNQVRTKDTAYRVSWMNATNENKVAVVYNAKNGAVIQQVSMPAGQDGVITGVVEASGGSAVQLAVKTENGTATIPVDYDNGDFSWPTMEENIKNSNNSENTEPTTPPTTEPTTPPTTEPTTSPTTEPSAPEETEPSTSEETEPSTSEVTEPSTSEVTEPSTSEVTEPSTPDATEPDANKGLSGGQITLIVVICVLLAAGGATAFLYVFKKDIFMLIVKKLTGKLTGAAVAVEVTQTVETAEVTEVTETAEKTETSE